MSDPITAALVTLFQRHRHVFWYDPTGEMRRAFDALQLPDVEKIEIESNPFGIKHRLLIVAPDQRFLLYQQGRRPDPKEDWLLDLLLAGGEFVADQVGLWISEMGLDPSDRGLVSEHQGFFRSAQRRAAYAQIARDQRLSVNAKRRWLLALCVGAKLPQLDDILFCLLADPHLERGPAYRLLLASNLDGFLWSQVADAIGYAPAEDVSEPLWGMVLALFGAAYRQAVDANAVATIPGASDFLRRWLDRWAYRSDCVRLSSQAARAVNLTDDLAGRSLRHLQDVHLFEAVERRVLSQLCVGVKDRTLSAQACQQLLEKRRASPWYDAYAPAYGAAWLGARLLEAIHQVDLNCRSAAAAVQRYCQTWFRIDQLYRQFTHAYRAASEKQIVAPPLETLNDEINNRYVNQFALVLGDAWQTCLEPLATWQIEGIERQDAFYDRYVAPLAEQKRVAVIVSDAMRYEIGEELSHRIQSEGRYRAEIAPLLALLPSVTALGMASLLPHGELQLDCHGNVSLDGSRTSGLAARQALLEAGSDPAAKAIHARDLMATGRQACRDLVKDCRILYVYHDVIDAIGDDRTSEERTVEAASTALDELVTLVKRLDGANVSSLLITADHGFLFQQQSVDEGDYTEVNLGAPADDTHRGRRYILGGTPTPPQRLWSRSATQLGIQSELTVHFARSINRLRLQGAGSRYVHGGTSLQEVVVPLVSVSVRRERDVELVDVEVLVGNSQTITTGQFTCRFHQTEPVSDKRLPRTLRLGLLSSDLQTCLSNRHTVVFDSGEPGRDRDRALQFVLNDQADAHNGKQVWLLLEERIGATDQFRVYKKVSYTLRLGFARDF